MSKIVLINSLSIAYSTHTSFVQCLFFFMIHDRLRVSLLRARSLPLSVYYSRFFDSIKCSWYPTLQSTYALVCSCSCMPHLFIFIIILCCLERAFLSLQSMSFDSNIHSFVLVVGFVRSLCGGRPIGITIASLTISSIITFSRCERNAIETIPSAHCLIKTHPTIVRVMLVPFPFRFFR